MTWAGQHSPKTQRAITDAYMMIGREIGATVVPVGVAWQEFLAKYKVPILRDKDKSHPTLAGSYLAACIFFAVLFGENPVGLEESFDGLSAVDAELLKRAAHDAVEAERD